MKYLIFAIQNQAVFAVVPADDTAELKAISEYPEEMKKIGVFESTEPLPPDKRYFAYLSHQKPHSPLVKLLKRPNRDIDFCEVQYDPS